VAAFFLGVHFGEGAAAAAAKPKTLQLSGGDSIGYECILGLTEDEQKHTGTAITTQETNFAALSRDEFLNVSETIGEATVSILEKIPSKRNSGDVEQIYSLFYQLPFIVKLRSKLLQHHCCRHFSCLRLAEGEVLYKQVRKTPLLEPFIYKTNILSRQARDNHRENSKKSGVLCRAR
jgi:hypothetical protein